MTTQEKALARTLFKLKVHEGDGDKYENIFTEIMNYEEPGFQQIKPWGPIGDRKNDGYIQSKEIYFQVYAPEDIRNNYPAVITKLETDFAGLKKQWPNVKEFYFVINDKFHGVNPDSEKILANIVKTHNLTKGGFLTPKDLENKLFKLSDDQIIAVTGFLPDTNSVSNLDFTILTEVIAFIMKLPIVPVMGKIEFPDWDEKIKFNKLSPWTKCYLEIGSQKLGALNQFISNQSFLADSLQEKLSGIYQSLRANPPEDNGQGFSGDFIFWEMVKQCSPKNEAHFESAIITIIAKYFESCDVFEKNPDKTF